MCVGGWGVIDKGGRDGGGKGGEDCPCSTCHIHRPVLIRRVPDAQLAAIVAAPALDFALGRDGARVAAPRCNGDGGDA
jgi:hypothetical protein